MRKRLKIFDSGVLKAVVKWNDGEFEIKTDDGALKGMIEILACDGVEDWTLENILFTTARSEIFLDKLKNYLEHRAFGLQCSEVIIYE